MIVERLVLDAADEVFEMQCIVVWGRCLQLLLPADERVNQLQHWNNVTCEMKARQIMRYTADVLRADMVRVDLLVDGECENLRVSEVELFPGRPMALASHERIMQYLLYGYGFDGMFGWVPHGIYSF